MTEHTPGPWRIDERPSHVGVLGGDGKKVAEAWLAFRDSETYWANARLIAAAPDLLEALQMLHDSNAEYGRINNLGGYDNNDMKASRAAIARAKGES